MSLIPGGDPRYDVSRTGSPVWARRDDGPLNTYVPGPMTSEPLQSSYHAGMRLGVSAVIFAAVIVFVLVNAQPGAVGSMLILVALWALYAVPVWLRGRIGMRVDGARCEVHGLFRAVAFEGPDVAKVQYVFAGRSPDVRLLLRDGRPVTVVASRLERGHSTLFEWLRRYAPEAVYDRKAIDLRDTLVNRGLMGAPGDSWDGYGPTKAEAPIPQRRGPMMTTNPEDLAARAAAAAAAGTHDVRNADGPHSTLEEVSDATFGLPDEERAAEILDHAEACDACAELVTELESVVELTQFAYPDPMPDSVEQRLMAALAAEAVGHTQHAAPSETPDVAGLSG